MSHDNPVAINTLTTAIEELGMAVVGSFAVEDDDQLEGGSVVLVGNAGSAIWPVFQGSNEAKDGQPHPMDRWSKRVLGVLAREHGAGILFPSDGPPYQPFQRWAVRANPAIAPSPIGIAIHPKWGLWWALRAAIIWPDELPQANTGAGEVPCTSCLDKPCLAGCPAGAFGSGRYDVAACASYVTPGTACFKGPCAARASCPVGGGFRYEPAHAAFHMNAFLLSRQGS